MIHRHSERPLGVATIVMGTIEEPIDIEELAKRSAEKMLDAPGRKKADLENPIIKWNK